MNHSLSVEPFLNQQSDSFLIYRQHNLQGLYNHLYHWLNTIPIDSLYKVDVHFHIFLSIP